MKAFLAVIVLVAGWNVAQCNRDGEECIRDSFQPSAMGDCEGIPESFCYQTVSMCFGNCTYDEESETCSLEDDTVNLCGEDYMQCQELVQNALRSCNYTEIADAFCGSVKAYAVPAIVIATALFAMIF